MSRIWKATLAERLAQQRASGRYRQRQVVGTPQGPEIELNGQRVLQFCSNDYLGLCADQDLSEAAAQAIERWGVGTGASHLVNGHTQAHEDLERDFARFSGRDGALLFSTGYMANLGVIEALADRSAEVFEDRLNHASLIDGARLSGARLRRYQHADVEHLGKLLAQSRAERKLVVTDAVFSMDGDLAPLPKLVELCTQHEALLMVDDAHGLGVLGPRGGGALEWFGLSQQDVPLLVVTLGKALGSAGALVSGPQWVMDALLQFTRTHIYTTALPSALAETARQALFRAEGAHSARMQLQMQIARFREGCLAMGLPLMESQTPIQPLLIGDAAVANEASARLLNAGIQVVAIRPPTVPDGTARLRITLTARHTAGHVDRLLAALNQEVRPLL